MIRVITLLLLLSMAGCATIVHEPHFRGFLQAHSVERMAVKQSAVPIMDTLHARLRGVYRA